jgi:hypothetical protein
MAGKQGRKNMAAKMMTAKKDESKQSQTQTKHSRYSR